MLNLSHEAIFAWEFDGGILAWNQGAERLYGFRSQEVAGCISHELLRSAGKDGVARLREALAREGSWAGNWSIPPRTAGL